jgi:hypothetical protein
MKAYTVPEILKMHDLSEEEMHEYRKLKKKVYGAGEFASLFIELDFSNPDHVRINELSAKIQGLYSFLLAHRNDSPHSCTGNAVQQIVNRYV